MADLESSQPDHYATLGLSPGATSQDVENAFHARVREHLQHANVSDKPIRERARQVGLAYETLRDPAKRRAYDESLAGTAAANADLPAERQPPRNISPRVMFTPVETVDRPPIADTRVAPREPLQEAAGPQREEPPVAAHTPVEPIDDQAFVVPAAAAPVEPVAAEPVIDEPIAAERVIDEPVGADEPVAAEELRAAGAAAERAEQDKPDAPAGHEATGWQGAAVPVAASTFVDEPVADHAPMVPWQARRRRSLHPGILAAAALIIVVGVGGVLLTGIGRHSPQQRVQAVLPVAVPPNHAAQPGQSPTMVPDQSAVAGATAPLPNQPATAATAQIPQEARIAAPLVTPPARTLEVKLPPPVPSTAAVDATAAASSSAAAAPPSAPTTTAAAPPAAAPAPAAAPPPAPVRQATSTQPFPRWLGGGLMNSDNPGGRYQGTVGVRFTVQPNGRVSGCRPVASSGDSALDSTTCSLVEERLRFSPALNAQGQPVATDVSTSYTWGRTFVPRRRRH